MEPLLRNLKNIVYPNQTTIINTGSLALVDVVPISSSFYYYQGSETDPECKEATMWIIFDTIQSLSASQMSRFRNILRTSTGGILIKNWRYLQPRNERKIFYSKQSTPFTVTTFEFDEAINVMNG